MAIKHQRYVQVSNICDRPDQSDICERHINLSKIFEILKYKMSQYSLLKDSYLEDSQLNR